MNKSQVAQSLIKLGFDPIELYYVNPKFPNILIRANLLLDGVLLLRGYVSGLTNPDEFDVRLDFEILSYIEIRYEFENLMSKLIAHNISSNLIKLGFNEIIYDSTYELRKDTFRLKVSFDTIFNDIALDIHARGGIDKIRVKDGKVNPVDSIKEAIKEIDIIDEDKEAIFESLTVKYDD